ncbi:MAG: hypothetical protein R3C69_12570 [Geminicoccaceae bacterium]
MPARSWEAAEAEPRRSWQRPPPRSTPTAAPGRTRCRPLARDTVLDLEEQLVRKLATDVEKTVGDAFATSRCSSG